MATSTFFFSSSRSSSFTRCGRWCFRRRRPTCRPATARASTASSTSCCCRRPPSRPTRTWTTSARRCSTSTRPTRTDWNTGFGTACPPHSSRFFFLLVRSAVFGFYNAVPLTFGFDCLFHFYIVFPSLTEFYWILLSFT